MCGIVAEHGALDPEELQRMLERISHRGPDDSGSVKLDAGWLGHARLSIVDIGGGQQPLAAARPRLSIVDMGGGRQPLASADGDLHLVGNGEVYNHEEIRESLSHVDFATDSDNEVALHLVDERGPGALAELNGMFAFVAAGRDRFVAARDPVGIKPLYWAKREDAVRFASEMHAFDPEWRPFVEPFPPGCYWTPDEGLVRFAFAVPERLTPPPEDQILTGTRDVLIDAVERQMMGDVPVGVFLSGGLDSSLVAAIAARYLEKRGKKLLTFAVGTPESPDLAAARLV